MPQLPSGREMADIAVLNGAIDMAQGVVHMPPPRVFLDLLTRHYDEKPTHVYASPAGYLPYREALLALTSKERPDLQIDNVMASNGTTGGIVSALRAHCKPADHVALLEPFYPAHDWAIQSLHLVTEYVPYADGFEIDYKKLGSAIRKSRAFILANPANPTGSLLSGEDLLSIYKLCHEHDVLLIVDEVYKDFIWEGEHASLLTLAENLDQVVIVRSFSKNLALAGWRAGFALTSAQRRAEMTHTHDSLYVGAPAASQIVMADLLKHHTDEIQSFVTEITRLYSQNREVVSQVFQDYGMEPVSKQGAYYMMVKHNRASDMAAMKELLDRGIAAAPGVPFFRPGTSDTGYIRIHFALSAEDCEKVQELLGDHKSISL